MSTARALFHQCRKAGIILAADGGDIAFDAPADVVVPVDDLRAHKSEVLSLLRAESDLLARRIGQQLDALRPYHAGRRIVWVHPAHLADVQALEGETLTPVAAAHAAALALIDRVPHAARRAELRIRLQEREGIAEPDGGVSRSEAERIALDELARAMEGGGQ